MNTVEQIQEELGVTADGIWGPKSQAELNKAIGQTLEEHGVLKRIQDILEVTVDGKWGVESQTALNTAIQGTDSFACDASSFADPADVRAFEKCKATGKSDLKCFAVGDNGIGQFGKITAQDKVPMVAIHATAMKARWGSIAGAAHRPVEVTVKGKTVNATVEDRISAPGRIDLNPAAAKKLGLTPPFVLPCEWKWA